MRPEMRDDATSAERGTSAALCNRPRRRRGDHSERPKTMGAAATHVMQRLAWRPRPPRSMRMDPTAGIRRPALASSYSASYAYHEDLQPSQRGAKGSLRARMTSDLSGRRRQSGDRPTCHRRCIIPPPAQQSLPPPACRPARRRLAPCAARRQPSSMPPAVRLARPCAALRRAFHPPQASAPWPTRPTQRPAPSCCLFQRSRASATAHPRAMTAPRGRLRGAASEESRSRDSLSAASSLRTPAIPR